MASPVRITPPAITPVSLAEAKAHLRVDFDDDDALIGSMIDAAVAHLDGWAGVLSRCLINQVWRQDFCGWPSNGCLRLPFADVSAAAVTYRDGADAEQTVSADLYEIVADERSSRVLFKTGFACPALSADRHHPVQITMTAGYGAAASAVPAAIRAAILMMAGHLYNHREAAGEPMAELPFAVSALVAPYRRTGV